MKNNQASGFHFPFFAILFGILPLLILWAQNRLQVSFRVVVPVFLLTLAAVVLVWGLCSLVFRSFIKGSYFSIFLFLLFFSFGHVYNLVDGVRLAGMEIGYLKLLIGYAALAMAGLVFFIFYKRFSSSSVIILNVITLALVAVNVGQLLFFQIQKTGVMNEKTVVETMEPVNETEQPDIYYIIVDAYSRADFLQETYGYDNSSFLSALEHRGFYIADCANSNYDGTLSSVTSSLNYEYLDYYNIPDDELSGGTGNEVRRLAKNRVIKQLRSYGYQYVTARGYSAFNDVRESDLYLNIVNDPGLQDDLQRSQFARLYLSTTLVRYVFEMYSANPSEYPHIPYWFELSSDNEFLDSSTFWYNQTRYVFDELEKIPGAAGSYFVYAHINAPHGPYVFDREGDFRYISPTDDKKEYYVDTVIYLNKRVLELVDTLINQSQVPPVIVIQADHGSHIVPGGFDKHKILSAYYLPGSDFELYSTITPVNTFRVILNEYFGQNLELLPDEIFVKVTDKREIYPSQCEYP